MKNTTYSISFSTLLTVAFIVLKLCGVIGWSWVWVLAPLWIGFLLTILYFVLLAVLMMDN